MVEEYFLCYKFSYVKMAMTSLSPKNKKGKLTHKIFLNPIKYIGKKANIK